MRIIFFDIIVSVLGQSFIIEINLWSTILALSEIKMKWNVTVDINFKSNYMNEDNLFW